MKADATNISMKPSTVLTGTVVLTLVVESKKKPSRITSGLSRVLRPLKYVQGTFSHLGGFFSAIVDRTNLTLKETVIIIILAYVFGSVAFIGYVRVEFSQLQNWPMMIVNYGFPLEWLQVKFLPKPMFRVRDVVILPVSLTLDIIVYFSAAFLLVYGIQRLRW